MADVSVSKRACSRGDIWAIAPHVLFVLLLAFNVTRTLRHAMWRDEMQVFLLGAYSPTLRELFRNLEYETHPDLWHLLVWFGARVYDYPVSMQVLHVALATCVWLLVWCVSPFKVVDKILLLLSYFLFWEYFVVSRNYVLVALFGFALAAVRSKMPRAVLPAFILAGALANTMILGTIWSMVVALRLALEPGNPARLRLGGAALYLVFLAVALLSIIPAADTVPYGSHLRFNPENLEDLAVIPAGALAPIQPLWLIDTVKFILGPHSAIAPHFWNPNPVDDLLRLAGGAPVRWAAIIAILLLPPILCWAVVRDWKLTAEFALTYIGIVMFASLWDFLGQSRQHGIVFLALVAAVWMASARVPLAGWRARTWRVLLVVSALGGLLTLTSETRIFSHGRSVAEWLARNRLADAFIMGSRDTTMSTISGYLQRPIYYLECECFGRFIVWNPRRSQFIDSAEIVRRAQRALAANRGRDVILIANRVITPQDIAVNAPDLTLTLLQTFAGAEVESENYFVFRAAMRSATDTMFPAGRIGLAP
jgi:hypothetical protein